MRCGKGRDEMWEGGKEGERKEEIKSKTKKEKD